MKRFLALLLALLMLTSLLVACKPKDDPNPDEDVTPGTDDPSDPTTDPSDLPPSGTQTGLYTPTAQKQRETYETVTAYGYDDGPYLIETVYVTEQVIIADIIITPEKYGVDPTGVADSTAGIQQALDDCYALGGGTVFLPVGRYVVTETVKVPYGVVLQGDWQDPDLTANPEYGTVILAKIPSLPDEDIYDPTAMPLFELLSEGDGNNGLIGLTVYYPDQDINNVKPYGYTVYGGRPRMVMLRDLTFINSYQGIGACLGGEGTHELLQVENVRMTVLSMGYKASLSREIGYTADLRISPRYWAEAAGEFACADTVALRNYCRDYAVGMEFYALDLNQYTDIYVEGCHTAMLSRDGFWGVFYDIEIKDCVYGFVADSLNGSSGVTIAKARIEADTYAVANYAIGMGALKLADVQATGKGGIFTAEGAKTVLDNDDDLSGYEPEYATYIRPVSTLYIAEVTDYDGVKEDAAPAIQAALDVAGTTGGIVYVPVGIYSLYTPLSVPTGVELRGASCMAIRDKEASGGVIPGTVFLTYVNEGDFITLAEKSGIQGIRIFYPSFDATTALSYLETNNDIINTSVAIRGTGERVYAMNMIVSGAMIGIDFTGCDNHAIKQSFGCAFNNFIRAGGQNGIIEAVLCNMTFTMRHPFFMRGYYDEDYITAANCSFHREGNNAGFATIRDKVLRTYNDTVFIVDAVNQSLNNVFMYGCHSILRADNAQVVCYNVTSDWQGICPMFNIQNNSDVVCFNPLRTSGKSHECDESSSLTMYNRILNGYFLEPTYRSTDGVAENAGGVEIDRLDVLNCDKTDNVKYVTLNTDKNYIKAGKGSLKSTYEKPSTLIEASFSPVDAGKLGTENLYLHLWIWIEDPNNLVWSGNSITLGNSREGYSYKWSTTSALGNPGWNEAWLPLDTGWKSADPMRFDGFDTFSITVSHSSLGILPDVYIDDVYLCQVLPYTDVAFEQGVVPTENYQRPEIAVEMKPTRIMINNCDTLDYLTENVIKITELNTDPAYVKEGTGSLKVQTTGQVFCELQFPATDAYAYRNYGYLHMWVYMDSAAGSGQIELTSSNTYDSGERSWSVASNIKKGGWNEIWLPIHQGSPAGTVVFDASNINYIRMYLTSGCGNKPIYIDDIYICNVIGAEYNESNTGKVGSALAAREELPLLHRCDNDKGIKGSALNTDPAYVKEGKGSLMSAPGVTERFVYVFNPIDITEYMDGYLHMWIYMENPQDLRSGYIELTSSGKCDIEEASWRIKDYVTQSGWNEILLPLTATANNALKPDKLSYMRIYTQWLEGKQDYKMYFDDIYFVDGDGTTPTTPSTPTEPTTPTTPEQPVTPPSPPSTPAVDEQGKLMLLDGESLPEGLSKDAQLSTDYVKQGKSSLLTKLGEVRLDYRFDPIDASAYKDGYLHMWVYVTDYDNLNRGFIELTSSGTYDANEISWAVMDHIKNDGWNEVWLPLNDFRGGDLDWTAVNFLRLYTIRNDATKDAAPMYFDDIYFANAKGQGGSTQPATPSTPTTPTTPSTPTVDEQGKLMLLDGESVPTELAKEVSLDTEHVKQGKSSLVTVQKVTRLQMVFEPMDISAYKTGYLHMWVYVTDYETIDRGFIELTSSGTCDAFETSFPVKDHIKNNGWNEVWLPLDKGANNGLVFTGFNYMRLYTNRTEGAEATPMYFDDIYFTNVR